MTEDFEPLIPEELPIEDEELGLDEEGNPKVKKPKDLIDDDTVSLDDEADDELEDDDDEPFDDVNDQ